LLLSQVFPKIRKKHWAFIKRKLPMSPKTTAAAIKQPHVYLVVMTKDSLVEDVS
jgi:hypothetical protein